MCAKSCRQRSKPRAVTGMTALAALVVVLFSGSGYAASLSITEAKWDRGDRELKVRGRGADGRTVTVTDASTGVTMGSRRVDDERWKVERDDPPTVPCRVRAQQSDGAVVERDVEDRPSSCNAAPTQPSVSVNDVTVAEGGTANFSVTLSAPSSQTVTVVVSTANGTAAAPGDFTGRSNVTVTFPAGSTNQSFAVTTVNDTVVENTEAFSVNLSGATNATIADAQGTGSITDNDQPVALPSMTVSDVTVAEGGTANFSVTLSAASAQTVTVVVSTANGTASAPGDFTARSNVTVSFPAGSTTQTFAVSTVNDTAVESTENFSVNLSGAVNATIADGQGLGTINDNDTAPQASLSVNDVTVTEGNSATFTITLTEPNASQVTVVFATGNGTAAAPGDFTAVSNRTLTIPAGQTSVTTQVVTSNDTVSETTETFNVVLSNAVNATIADGQGVGTITDNDFTSAAQAHATMTTYDGPQTCIACHASQALAMHGSVHYQQNGPTDFVTNIAGLAGEGPAGKPSGVNAVIGINTYCGTHENSPRFTCAGCHVGNGRFPKTPGELAGLGNGTAPTPSNLNAAQLQELANIDCLTCHQQTYKRFPDWTAGGAGFTDLTLLNVALDSNGLLIPAPGQSVTRTGLAGIPNVDPNTLDFMFRPSGAPGSLIPLPAGAPQGPMTLTTEQAAQQVHATTRQSCLNCHAGAGGANGAKRGDLSTLNAASTDNNLDRHMSMGAGGSNMTCSSCHNVNDASGNSIHRVRGRGLDLRANDHATRFTCDSAGCHNASTVHNSVTNGATFARHVNKVACQTCHIPGYGKGVATEIARDWQKPHVTQTACNGRGGWLPEETKSSTATPPVPVMPSYQWFDGTSQVYYLGESLADTPTKPLPANIATLFSMPAGTSAYVMGRPNPNPDNATTRVTGAGNNAAKIYPMKEHWGKLARNTANNTLVPHSTFEFFRTGSFCRGVAVGLGMNADTACGTGQNTGVPSGAQVVPVHTYQTINHGVEPRANALGANNTCGTCHDVAISGFTTGKPLRMFLERDMGYAVTRSGITVGANGTVTCSNIGCHGGETGNFTNIHSRSNHRNAGCNACHGQITGR